MAFYKLQRSRRAVLALPLVAGLMAFAPKLAFAQRAGARPGLPIARPAPIASRYGRPMTARSMRPLIPQGMPVQPMNRPTMVRRLSSRRATFRYPRPLPIEPLGTRTFLTPRSFAAPVFHSPNSGGAFGFSRGAEWRGIGPYGYSTPFWIGNPGFPGAGYYASSNYQMLPLGFGLWPACDSSAIPGRFWTVGPCAGIGDYAAVTPSPESQCAAPGYSYELQPEFVVEEPQPAAPSAKEPSGPQTKPAMEVYLTDGRALPVSDWWVTEGRFYFILLNGHTETVDLPTLDLRKTIEQNEKQGLTFMLNFTPPDERPVLPALPSPR
jgi:hypothetical protein